MSGLLLNLIWFTTFNVSEKSGPVLLESCNKGSNCTSLDFCHSALGLKLGIEFSGDPAQRDDLKSKLDGRQCLKNDGKQTEAYCCNMTDISKDSLSSKFSKYSTLENMYV